MASHHKSLTVVTLNTWKGAGDYARRLALMTEGMTALKPDIVFLQEAILEEATLAPDKDTGPRTRAADGIDTGGALAAALNMGCIVEPARPESRHVGERTVDSTLGLAILSRLPLSPPRRLDLPTDPRDGERIGLMATVRWRERTLGLVNLHLTYLPDADDLRRRQLEVVLSEIENEPHRAGVAIDAWLIAGDFNAEDTSPPLRWLRTAPALIVNNAWDAAGGPSPTITEPEGTTTLGTRCVDHVFLVQGRREAGHHPRFTFAEAGRVFDTPDPATGILPSDHAGLRAVLMEL